MNCAMENNILSHFQGGLMVVNMSGDDSRILALHDDIALSDEYSEGSPDVKDMTIDSSFSMLYIIVNDGE